MVSLGKERSDGSKAGGGRSGRKKGSGKKKGTHWERHYSSDHRAYYWWNRDTEESKWEGAIHPGDQAPPYSYNRTILSSGLTSFLRSYSFIISHSDVFRNCGGIIRARD